MLHQSKEQCSILHLSLLVYGLLFPLLAPNLFHKLPPPESLCVRIQPQHHVEILQRILLLRGSLLLRPANTNTHTTHSDIISSQRFLSYLAGRTTFCISSELINLDRSVWIIFGRGRLTCKHSKSDVNSTLYHSLVIVLHCRPLAPCAIQIIKLVKGSSGPDTEASHVPTRS